MRKSLFKLVLTSFLLGALSLGPTTAKEAAPSVGSTVAVDALPVQGRDTYVRIFQGGPFPFEKDGVVFFNRERLLPLHPRGYYREYTVKTPGMQGRGARRIVCGGPKTQPDTCYYTADHYASFRKIVP